MPLHGMKLEPLYQMKRKQKVFAFSQKKYIWTANRIPNAMKQHSSGYQQHQVNNDSQITYMHCHFLSYTVSYDYRI
jgi:hypothetical protein